MDTAQETKVQLLQDIVALCQRLAPLEGKPLGGADQERLMQVEQEHDALRVSLETCTQELAASEVRLRAVLETVIDGIITINECGRIESVNPAAERLFGYRAADLVDQNVTMLMPSPYREEHDGYLARYLRTGEKRIIGIGREVVGQRRDGSTFPMALSVSEGRLGDRRVFMGIVRDITARKQSEAALQSETTFSERLLDTAQMIILVLDTQGHIVRFNSYLEALSGYRLEEVQGQDWVTTFLPARDWNRIRTVFEQSIHGAPSRGNVNPIVTQTGLERQIEWFGACLKDASGKITGILSIGQDITEQRHTQGALREREHQLQLLTDALPVLIAYVDAEQRFRLNNQTYERWFGQPRTSFYGKHVEEVIGTQAYEAIRPYIEAALAGQMVTFEGIVPYEQLGTRVIRATYVPDRDDAGHVSGYFALVSDITERKRTEAALRRTEHLALLGRLAAGVSHDLRNPLNAIFLHMDILQEELLQPSPDSQTQLAESIAEVRLQLTRMHELVQDYLSLARLASPQREPADLGTFVKACAQEMEALVARRGITLSLCGLASLGEVAFHPNTLRRALANLMQNALDAMTEGGRLTLRGRRTALHVRLEIRDTGIGIPKDELPLIFEPLHTTKPDGTGLGLYLVREIVVAHEGRIQVESVPGEGTTFTITLPRAGLTHRQCEATSHG